MEGVFWKGDLKVNRLQMGDEMNSSDCGHMDNWVKCVWDGLWSGWYWPGHGRSVLSQDVAADHGQDG